MSPAAIAADGAPRMRTLQWTALGDSFTAGIATGERTWPELIASSAGHRLRLDNLARAGATVAEVRREQLPAAIAAAPDVLTVICGGNDVIASVRPELERVAEELDELLGALRAALPRTAMVTATYPPIGPAAGVRPRTRERIERGLAGVNEAVRAAAATHGLDCVELAGHPGSSRSGNYADDGIHPSPLGHREAARTLAPAIDGATRRARIPTTNEEKR